MRSRANTSERIVGLLTLLVLSVPAWGQHGDAVYRRSAILNGNQVRTVFGNWGVIGQPAEAGHRGAWKYDNNGYLGDVSLFLGGEAKYTWPNPAGHTAPDTLFRSVETCPVSRPATRQDVDPVSGKQWTLEPLPGYFAGAPNQSIALSNDPRTWPAQWPDKLSDATDPGWAGKWNGYFGKRASADLETYFVMDDNNDERFNLATNNIGHVAFRPDSRDLTRNGLGFQVNVRAMQWGQFLAKDNIFWLYEITNTGTSDYARAVFGLLVGTYVGCSATDDSPQEYNDDWSFYDAPNNLTYTGDYKRILGLPMKNPLWTGPVGMVGYAFLESPGNPYDGIDNDGDADSSAAGRTAPQFNSTSFTDTSVILPGQQLVMIANDYSRSLFRVPNVDSVKIWTRGMEDSVWIYPGRTHRVAEGNVLVDAAQNTYINPNAYDGIDNNFNGLIDENFFIHYRQIKRSSPQHPPIVTLIDNLRPLRYVNYLTGLGTGPNSMIDERRDDLIDNNNDWSRDRPNGALRFDPAGNLLDDVGRDGIQNTNDFGERDGFPTSGYDALGHDTGLPGEPHIDKTDVNESDQIGLTSFYYFEPSGDINLADKDSLWGQLRPGSFAVPSNIQFNPGAGTSRPTRGSDGDFIWGTGFFPLLAGKTERFSIALVYGGGQVGGNVEGDIADLLKNKQTVQKIYNSNYQFPTPPEVPSVTAVTGDRKVTLYWDRRSEDFVDPVLHVKTFEGYKVYRSTDPGFLDIFTITDASGIPQGYRPLAQFDLNDGIKGNFQPTGDLFTQSNGYIIYLGNDTGVQHSFVDSGDVDNGRRYFYAVTAYSKGDNVLGLFPAENNKGVKVTTSGEITLDRNVVMVVPNAKVAGYVEPGTNVPLDHTQVFGTGQTFYKVVDETKLNAHTYSVGFVDTQIDSLDYDGNIVRNSQDSTQWQRITKSYSVKDLTQYSEQFSSRDTFLVYLTRKNLIPSTVTVLSAQGAIVPPANYRLDPGLGTIRGASHGGLPTDRGTYTIKYNFYPVFRSPYIGGSPYAGETKDADIFDGVQLSFNNVWGVNKVDSLSGWTGPSAYIYSFAPLNTNINDVTFLGYRSPNDYEIQFYNTIVDTSTPDPDLLVTDAIPVNFRIFNSTDRTYLKFVLFETSPVPGSVGKLSPGDDIVLLERNPRGTYSRTWDMFFSAKQGDPTDTVYNLTTGDKLTLKTTKPFRYGDQFQFATVPPKIDNALAKNVLDRIRVVPNPYVTASAFEPPLPPGTTGRGGRKIDFIHLPVGASIKIFTARGDHVMTLYQEGNIEDGAVSWNLKTKENLDIAYGVYFYVVESPVGNKTGKIAIIK